ncbi:APN2 [Candida pseudojiufengensis]|uniref:APN2 n=1 Tax=Candida pseudojiufengensis TaxID=497109 RepID=UPI002224FB62|nr:APN2 [Candida pseudojiufengensis]KAI5964664.1 APN2 [Candida pseudojiufengensis]
MEEILSQPPFTKIPIKKSNKTIRFLTFNVNGIKTICNYHPWNQFKQEFNDIFLSLKSDIITLQELKLTINTTLNEIKNIGHLKNYRSFISLPTKKKGYSGVGLFIKKPENDEEKQIYTVVKAEEGLTGYLSDKSGTRYRDQEDKIGGYTNDMSESEALNLDSEGRCVIVELINNLVIFALYCPANSQGTEEGETFRLLFLQQLLKRCENLHNLGKRIIIMGDINVSLDLIDSAEGINDRLGLKIIEDIRDGVNFEIENYKECINFKFSRKSRELMNKYVIQSMIYLLRDKQKINYSNYQIFYDTTRIYQGRRKKMYTVWNTLTSSRQINYGSRIDLILCNCTKMIKHTSNADILPFIQGSDHCPVFTDFENWNEENEEGKEKKDIMIELNKYQDKKIMFEAKNHFKLNKIRDISTLFGKRNFIESNGSSESISSSTSSRTSSPQPEISKDNKETETDQKSNSKKPKVLVYKSRKTIDNNKLSSSSKKSINDYFL